MKNVALPSLGVQVLRQTSLHNGGDFFAEETVRRFLFLFEDSLNNKAVRKASLWFFA
jgi:hypothetical protein